MQEVRANRDRSVQQTSRITKILNSRPAAARLTSFAVYIGVISLRKVASIVRVDKSICCRYCEYLLGNIRDTVST